MHTYILQAIEAGRPHQLTKNPLARASTHVVRDIGALSTASWQENNGRLSGFTRSPVEPPASLAQVFSLTSPHVAPLAESIQVWARVFVKRCNTTSPGETHTRQAQSERAIQAIESGFHFFFPF